MFWKKNKKRNIHENLSSRHFLFQVFLHNSSAECIKTLFIHKIRVSDKKEMVLAHRYLCGVSLQNNVST